MPWMVRKRLTQPQNSIDGSYGKMGLWGVLQLSFHSCPKTWEALPKIAEASLECPWSRAQCGEVIQNRWQLHVDVWKPSIWTSFVFWWIWFLFIYFYFCTRFLSVWAWIGISTARLEPWALTDPWSLRKWTSKSKPDEENKNSWNLFVLIQLTKLCHQDLHAFFDHRSDTSACTTLLKAMFQAMEMIDISSPEAARKSISTVMAHLRALDQFLQQISSSQEMPTEETQLTKTIDKLPGKVRPCRIDLEVQCSCTAPGDTVVVVGSCPELGNWKVERGLPLCTSQELYPKWTGRLEIESCAACDVQFKLAILRPCSHEWERRDNRNLSLPKEQDENEGGHWQALLTFSMNDDVKVLKLSPANAIENQKNDERPLPNLLLRGHGVDTERDEVKVEKPAITQQVLDKTFKDKVIGHSHGLITGAQRAGNERQEFTVGEIPFNRPYFVSCQKGSKSTQGYDPPNQDNWSVTAFKSGWTLFCVHDGHGPYGHYVSTRTVQTVPWFLIEESDFDKDSIDEECIEQALLDAFQKSEADLVRYAVASKKDVSESGSTALAVLLKGNKMWTANLDRVPCGRGQRVCPLWGFTRQDLLRYWCFDHE